jgi:hypothetical protein
MKIREIKFQKKSVDLLDKIKNILKEYEQKNIRVTLRQLYYQLVAKGLIANSQKEYKKISSLLTNARYSGIIDWFAIEDRIRKPNIPNTFENISHLLQVASRSYALDRWNEQEYYVELWTEKDAISSVISPITDKYQVPIVINRGYSSASSMYESAQRFLEHSDKRIILLYLGDHDPSGLDMDRDIKARLQEFGVGLEVVRIGLTFEQVQEYNPPKNPTKMKDTRATDYVQKYGHSCWEVDSLNPEILQGLIEENILQFLDLNKYEQVKQKEQEDLQELRQ